MTDENYACMNAFIIYLFTYIFIYLFVFRLTTVSVSQTTLCCEIWGFQGGDYKDGWLLRCDAMYSARIVPKYQDYALSIITVEK
jgi:hypothetical protein